MKKLLLSFVLLFSMNSFAQDWAPFKTTDTIRHFSSIYNYGQTIESNVIQSVVVNSINITSNRTDLVFKKGFTRANGNSQAHYKQKIKGQILGDSAIINIDSSIYTTTDVFGFKLIFPHSIYFGKTFTLGKNVSNQSLIATVDSIYIDSVNNGIDSIARLNLILTDPLGLPQTTSDYHNKKILLSKSNGMLSGIDFTNLETVVEVDQFFSQKNNFKYSDHYALTVGDEYHYTDNLRQNFFGDYYETTTKVIADSVSGNSRTISFEQKRKKVFPSLNPGPVQTTKFSKTFINSDEYVQFESQIIEDIYINQQPFFSSVIPVTNLFYTCYSCGFNQLGFMNDTSYFLLEASSTMNGRDSLFNFRAGLYEYYEYNMLGIGDFGLHFYHNGSTAEKSIVYIKKGNQTWGTPLNLSVGLNEVQQINSTKIYPNPVQSQLTISTTEEIELVEILDFQGKLLKHSRNQNQVDVSEFSTGIYFIRINTKRGTFIRKFIKE